MSSRKEVHWNAKSLEYSPSSSSGKLCFSSPTPTQPPSIHHISTIPLPPQSPTSGPISQCLDYGDRSRVLSWDFSLPYRDDETFGLDPNVLVTSAFTPSRNEVYVVSSIRALAGDIIRIRAESGDSFVTVGAVLRKLWKHFRQKLPTKLVSPSAEEQFERRWSTVLGHIPRRSITPEMRDMVNDERDKGMKLVDCLDGRTMFNGLSRAQEPSTWMIHLVTPRRYERSSR